jgi:cell division protein FtsB
MPLFANPASREPRQGWLVSLAFWLCLFTAAVLYGTVTLSPKLLAFLELDRQHRTNQWRLVSQERQVAHLQRVIEAQTNDPAFMREQARSDLDVANSDEQRIPVESHLRLNIESGNAALPAANPDLPRYAVLLEFVARSHRVGSALLGAAAILVLYAFTRLYVRSAA